MRRIGVALLLGLALVAQPICSWANESVQAAAVSSMVSGVWEGPWYRGMTSGRAKLQIDGDGGTIQFSNLDKFGPAQHPLGNAAFADGIYEFRTEGESGGVLTGRVKLNEAGTEMKGMGKFDGFPLRFELKRVPSQ
jgi:hypothetical protein